MIKIDALYFLIIVELLVVFAVGTVLFIVRGKKYLTLYQSSVKDLEVARTELEALRKQPAEIQTAVPPQAAEQDAGLGEAADAAPAMEINELENCKIELAALEVQVKEKDKLVKDLQAKLDDVEKEYLILYQAQQAAKQP
jgi:type II secretory pathway component PulM